jgi:glutamate-1-semialdehyde 2,1-aminomutase
MHRGVGGRRDVMEHLAAGIGGTGERAYIGGTLSANPLSCAAGYYALLEIEKTDALAKAGRAGDRLCRGLEALIAERELPFVSYNYGSIVHLQTSGVLLLNLMDQNALAEVKPRKHMLEEMGAAMTAEGVVTLAGSRLYTSLADTDAVVDDALERIGRVLQAVEGL